IASTACVRPKEIAPTSTSGISITPPTIPSISISKISIGRPAPPVHVSEVSIAITETIERTWQRRFSASGAALSSEWKEDWRLDGPGVRPQAPVQRVGRGEDALDGRPADPVARLRLAGGEQAMESIPPRILALDEQQVGRRIAGEQPGID